MSGVPKNFDAENPLILPPIVKVRRGRVKLEDEDFEELQTILLDDDTFMADPPNFLVRAGIPRRKVDNWQLKSDIPAVKAQGVIQRLSNYGILDDVPYHALGALIKRLIANGVGRETRLYLESLLLNYNLTSVPQLVSDPGNLKAVIEGRSKRVNFGFNFPYNDKSYLEAMHEPEKWFQDVSFLIEGAQSLRAVCRIETGNHPLGTGFLVAPKLVLTNYHVLMESPGETLELKARNLNFRFGYMRSGNQIIPGNRVLAEINGKIVIAHSPVEELDYALIKLGEEAGSENKFGFLKVAPRDIVPGEAALVMQHPEGQPMKFLSNVVVGYLPERKRVHYLTGTLAGSSGSPVFDGDWQVIALHHSGSPVPELPPELDISANEGITMKAIYPELKEYLTSI